MNFFQTVYHIVREIPYGRVMSYGQVARLAGKPTMARQVGWALHGCKEEDQVPWYRVVRKDGQIAERLPLDAEDIQRELLSAEGVTFDEAGRVKPKYFI